MEYNPCRIERNAVLRYLLAVRRDDAEQIAYFEGFGNSVQQIILNVRTYERGLLFGYTAKQFDECGWDMRDAPYRGAYRAGYTQYNPYRTVDRRHICRNGRLEHGRRRRRQPPVGLERADQRLQDRRKTRYRRVGIALHLCDGAELRQHQLQRLEDTQTHGETQRNQTAVFGAEATLLVRLRLKPSRKEQPPSAQADGGCFISTVSLCFSDDQSS